MENETSRQQTLGGDQPEQVPTQQAVPSGQEPKKKRGLIIVLIVIGVLVVAGVSGAVVYLVLNKDKQKEETQTPAAESEVEVKELTAEEAYDEALAKLTDGDYYEYDSEGDLPVAISAAAFPQLDVNLDIDGTEVGKINLEDGDSHYLTELSVDTEKSTKEVYFIDGKVYARESLSSDFTEYTEEEAAEAGYAHSAVLDVIIDLSDDAEYTVEEVETLDGREQFVYLVVLTEEELVEFIGELNKTLESEGMQVSQDQVTVEEAQVKIWIDKENATVTQGILTVQKIVLVGTYEGFNVNFTLDDVDATMTFDKWGEVREIVLPT